MDRESPNHTMVELNRGILQNTRFILETPLA